ncbi:hypothetical protein ROA7745_03844 [Roseovarius aestuarii]|uniref:Uncharacterized protein n=1 Tax=Roseovarius aestuarii TaxID=475083 RepID=A0A1X7BWE7_9RHOB|nr:hypothetical protein ROA7745_03844 [Roseovarius aestuarii]
MSSPFGPSPKLREYCDWARLNAECRVDEGYSGNKSIVRITAPDGKSVKQVGIPDDEPLCHSVVAYLDRRLGVDSPFPKTPDDFI